MKVDWSEVQAAFVTGDPRPTHKALAEKFGVSVRQICRHSKSENWKSLRDKFWTPPAPDVTSQIDDDLSDPVSLLENILKKIYAQFHAAPVSDTGNLVREIRGLIKLLDSIKPEKKEPEVPRENAGCVDLFLYRLEKEAPDLVFDFADVVWDFYKSGRLKYMHEKVLYPWKQIIFDDFYDWLKGFPDRFDQFLDTCLEKKYANFLRIKNGIPIKNFDPHLRGTGLEVEKDFDFENVTSQKKVDPPPGGAPGIKEKKLQRK